MKFKGMRWTKQFSVENYNQLQINAKQAPTTQKKTPWCNVLLQCKVKLSFISSLQLSFMIDTEQRMTQAPPFLLCMFAVWAQVVLTLGARCVFARRSVAFCS